MIDTIYSDPEYLQHYGVKGMKWGRRKQQPTSGKKRQGLSDKQKKVIKTAAIVGLSAATAGLAIYGAKRYSSIKKVKQQVIVTGKSAAYELGVSIDNFEFYDGTKRTNYSVIKDGQNYNNIKKKEAEYLIRSSGKTKQEALDMLNRELFNKNADLLKQAQALQR